MVANTGQLWHFINTYSLIGYCIIHGFTFSFISLIPGLLPFIKEKCINYQRDTLRNMFLYNWFVYIGYTNCWWEGLYHPDLIWSTRRNTLLGQQYQDKYEGFCVAWNPLSIQQLFLVYNCDRWWRIWVCREIHNERESRVVQWWTFGQSFPCS